MGSFGGHILPGTFLIVFSLHWIIGSFSRYYRALVRRNRQNDHQIKNSFGYKCTVTFPFPFCPKYPLEGLLKLFAGGIGIAAEVATGIKRNGTYFEMENSQHVCMYFFIALSGIVDILMVCSQNCLPRNTDYITLLVSITIITMLFSNHVGTQLESHLHRLLTTSIIFIGIGLLLEMKFPRNPLCTWLRCLGTLLSGTWFLEIAFVLFNPWPDSRVWRENKHDMMLLSVIFAGHLAVDALAIALIGYLMYLKYRKGLKEASFSYQELDMDVKGVVDNGRVCVKCKKDVISEED